MKETNKKSEKAQGAINAETLNEQYVREEKEKGFHVEPEEIIEAFGVNPKGETSEIEPTEKKKERKPNTIYTLKSFKEHINKLATYKVCTAEEITQLRKIHKTATERWIGLTMEE